MTNADQADCASDDERHAAIGRRDAAFDGRFVYGVSTTGIYCRPSCAARRALAANMSFHASGRDAERAGFRACLRCRPDGPSETERHAALVAAACRMIARSDTIPALDAIARDVGVSPSHLHRIFRKHTGLTPKRYAEALRAARLDQALAAANSVTASVYEAGFNAPSRFYAQAPGRLGMSPRASRRGGVAQTIRFAVGQCALGAILVAATEKGVCAISLGDDPEVLVRALQDRFAAATLIGGDAEFERMVARVVGFVETPGRVLDLPLDIRGTVFQQRVWEALRAIPAGTTASYAQVASAIGRENAARAVAHACAANTLAVAIPCHRVIATDGRLSGYRWGVARKRALLDRERAKWGSAPDPARDL